MARLINKASVVRLAHTYWPDWRRAHANAKLLDLWQRGKQYTIDDRDADDPFGGRPFSPRQNTSTEYDDLASRSPAAWGGLIVKSLAQTAYVTGARIPGSKDNMKVWATWQQNRMDSKQTAIHRATIGHGAAYGIVLPGKNPMTGDKMAKMSARSMLRMNAFYDEDDDEWPRLAIDAKPYRTIDSYGWNIELYDDVAVHYLTCKGDGAEIADWEYISYEPHPMGVTPVARCVNSLDLDGRATGEIEPVLPLLRRIDQDTFDRLIVQRFGAWKVRYIAGMARPSSTQMANLQAMKLKVEDLLISGNKDTKFGTLDATSMKDFIEAHDADLRVLSAITQTPPHHLLGLSANLQAEALAAAEAGLQRKSTDFKINAGEFHEQMLRMAAFIEGYEDEARAFDMQVRWADTESRSYAQTVQALGVAATQLKVPLEMLWEKMPHWTDGDTQRAKELIEDGRMDAILAALEELGGDPGAGDGGLDQAA